MKWTRLAGSLATCAVTSATIPAAPAFTAHAKNGALPEDFDWRALADPRATTAVYMGLRTLPALVARLLAEGMAPDTPAALVESASLPGERRFLSTIGALPEVAAQARASGPCMVLIGRVLRRPS